MHYVVQSLDEYDEFGGDALLTGEMVMSRDKAHCPSATVGTSTAASHLDTVYECCTKKRDVDILSSAYAFGGLLMAVVIYSLALVGVPMEVRVFHRDDRDRDTMC